MVDFRAPSSSFMLACVLVVFLLYVRPAHAFGAGNIGSTSKVEGQNWRHGDIEDTLLTLMMSRAAGKKFSKLDVKRVYFGNWLRDYSQAVDVGTVKMVSAEAIRILLWVLGFMSFGYGTKEFEVTTERLGCYRPEEHIDNPKDYADNADARQYDRRLRGPVDERRELSIDPRTGMKNYIASEDQGITTSAGLVRDLYRRCIQLARQSKRSGNKDDMYEAFRLLGTANHCLEDFSAHSNFVELCLIEMGERNVFPHVGRRTQMQVRGARDRIWPLITGTFGGVDFLHSVMGELSDKSTQSEVAELEGTISSAGNNRQAASMVKELLNKLPDGLFGGEKSGKVDELQANSSAGQMQNMHISPKEPEEFTRQAEEIRRQIYPVLEFHDNIMHSITEAIDKIPVLPDLIESLQEQMNVFVFSLIAPFVLPIIQQVKAELETGSSEIIQSSRDKQLVVFHDDNSTDPTHSMISKDHFSNVLNEPAGKVASQVLKWVVPQIVDCWDDERADVDRTINRIINGVFHHPALRAQGEDGASEARGQMFHVVESWWGGLSQREQGDLRDKLSREGVENGRNHKEGVQDSGHGCGKPLGMPNAGTAGSSGAIGGVLGANLMGNLNQAIGSQSSSNYGGGGGGRRPQDPFSQGAGKVAGDAVGGGILGSIVGGVVGGVGASLLGGNFSGDADKHKTYQQQSQNQDGSYVSSYTETGHQPASNYGGEEKYGQAEYKRTDYPQGGRREEYSRYEQDIRPDQGTSGYGFQQTVESKPTSGGGYQRTEEKKYERPGGQWQSETRMEGVGQSGEYYSSETKHHGSSSYNRSDDEDDEKKARKHREKEEKKREKARKKQQGYGGGDSEDDSDDEKKHRRQSKEHGRRDDSDDEKRNKRHSGDHHRQQQSYGQEQGYGGRQESSYGGRQEGYGGQQESNYGGRQESSYGGRQEASYGGRQESSYGGRQEGYGGQPEPSYGGRQEPSYGGRQEPGYGGRQESNYSDQQEGYGGGRSEYSEQDQGYGGRSQRQYGNREEEDVDEYGERRSRRQQGGNEYGGGY